MPLARYERIKYFCSDCPVKTECLASALIEEATIEGGKWRKGARGGMSPNERLSLSVAWGLEDVGVVA